jgi:hypothetical protein
MSTSSCIAPLAKAWREYNFIIFFNIARHCCKEIVEVERALCVPHDDECDVVRPSERRGVARHELAEGETLAADTVNDSDDGNAVDGGVRCKWAPRTQCMSVEGG